MHCAALSRPMDIHDKKTIKGIDLNFIRTVNMVKICSDLKIKLIYFLTGYIYPGKIGSNNDNDLVFAINNYTWSKLGG
jgi:dTDP-4-dehydrorhamnose reductase